MQRETAEKILALGFTHAAGLDPHRDVRVGAGKRFEYLLQIGITAEERQVVARLRSVLFAHHLGDGRQAGQPMLIPGGQIAGDPHIQLCREKGGFHVEPLALLGQAEQVRVICRRAQGGGKQGARMGCGKARCQKGRRHHIAQAQNRQGAGTARGQAGDVEQ